MDAGPSGSQDERLRKRSLNLSFRDRPGANQLETGPEQRLIGGTDRVAEDGHHVEHVAQRDDRERVPVLGRPVLKLGLRGRAALRPGVVRPVDDEALVFVLLVRCLQTGGVRGAKASRKVP